MSLTIKSSSCLPTRSKYVVWAEMVAITGVEPWQMAKLVELDWVRPVVTADRDYLFRLRDALRVKRMLRICQDLDVSLHGATIIVDLTDRIEHLEREVEELKRLL